MEDDAMASVEFLLKDLLAAKVGIGEAIVAKLETELLRVSLCYLTIAERRVANQ